MSVIPNFSIAQLEQEWESQGGNPQVAPIAASIAEAESSGNPSALGYFSPSLGYDTPSPQSDTSQTDEGLWGIANLNAGGSGATVVPSLLNPAYNAKMAVWLSSNGTNWSKWGSAISQNGQPPAYQKYLPEAYSAASGGTLQNQSQQTTQTQTQTTSSNSVTGFFQQWWHNFTSALGNDIWTVNHWWIIPLAIGLFLIGLFLALGGENTTNLAISTGKAAGKAAETAGAIVAE